MLEVKIDLPAGQQSRIKHGIGISDTDSILLFIFHFPLDQYIQYKKKKK